MTRIDAMKLILAALPHEPVIANCGATSRELASICHSDQHLYILDSMGIASSVGLGLALALNGSPTEPAAERPIDRVVVLEGDGALLMNLNSLASIAYHRPRKLLLTVLDNGAYASTGGQPTYATALDLAAMAQSTGLKTLVAASKVELTDCLAQLGEIDETVFLHVKIAAGNAPDIPLLLEDPAVIAHRFNRWLQGAPSPTAHEGPWVCGR